MGAGVVRVNTTMMAAGLFWQAAPTVAAALREARVVAGKGQLDCDLLCLRRNGLPQFGLGWKNAGHRAGMPAVAVALANAVDHMSWLGLFSVNRQWLLVMVRKGAILPDGDQLFDSQEEARQAFDAASARLWDGVFVPSGWQVPGSKAAGLADILGKRPGHGRLDGRLRNVGGRRWWPLPAALALAGGGAAAWLGLVSHGPEVSGLASPPPPPPPPWLGMPVPVTVIAACQQAIKATRTLPGFEIESVSCDGLTSVASYRRRWGSLAWLPEAVAANNPDLATVSNRLTGQVEARRGDEPPWTVEHLRRYLWGASQSLRLSSEIAQPVVEKPKIGGGGEAVPVPPVRAVTMSLGGGLPASALGAILKAIPALVVEDVGWRDARWTVKGKVYVR